jgi:imidazolonepropionase
LQTRPIFIRNANEVITVSGGSETPLTKERMSELNIIHHGSVWMEDGEIQAVGTDEELASAFSSRLQEALQVDASGKIVMPGLVDPHTHLVHAGTREDEFNMRLQGSTYMEIMNNGGGIHASTSKTRCATPDQLFKKAMKHLDSFLLHGVTTVEAKSGYGLDWENERKQLQVALRLQEAHPVDVVSTFMGAHAIPIQFKEDPDAFVDYIIQEMLPKVKEENLAEFNDVFCEEGVFTPEQTKRILEAGKEFGLIPKIHADEIEPYKGAELAAETGAISADHLLKASDEGIAKMAEKNIVGVLLPGTAFFLMAEFARARRMIDSGVPVALATDFNPGSSPTTSLPFIMNLACLKMGMSPAEAIVACTINAAHALNRASEIGSLEKGKKADVVIMDVPNYLMLQYHYGMNHTHSVIKEGRLVVDGGRLCDMN